MDAILSIAYFPPVSYFMACQEAEKITIDAHEHFSKQSYRNRCLIDGPNDILPLVIPVVHDDLSHTPVSKVRVSDDAAWKKIHWKSLQTSYRRSPYFEFYEEEISGLLFSGEKYLFDNNLRIIRFLFNCFGIQKEISLTDEYRKAYPETRDLRYAIHPKKIFSSVPAYRQVFSDRHGFRNDLSVLDFLFNAGNRLPSGS